MSVYVDKLQVWPNGKGYWKGRPSCHLIADDEEELKIFAVDRLGLRLLWIQYPKNKYSIVHFDLTESKRRQAIELGAIELDNKQFVDKMRQLRETPKPRTENICKKYL